MSSIDKYVEDTARSYDSRIRVTNNFGRIVGKINGEVIFNISDRYGFLNDSERQTIYSQIELYHEKENEERKIREEEERRRKEEERQRELANLENEINNKLQTININIQNLKNIYQEKRTTAIQMNDNVEEIKNILPLANTEGLTTKNANLLANLENKYLSSNNELINIKLSIQDIQKSFNKNSSIDDLLKAKEQLTKINLNPKNYDLKTEIEITKKEINETKQNALSLARIIKDSSIITDEFVKSQIYQEINNINIIDHKKITMALNSIQNRIETHKISLVRKENDEKIKKFNNLEALIKATKDLIEFNVNDTYSLNNKTEQNHKFASNAMEKLLKLNQIPFKVTNMDLTKIQTELYKKMLNPSDVEDDQKWLKDLMNNLDVELDKASIYQNQYEEFSKLKEELKQYGINEIEEFNCENSLAQLQSLESKIINQMEEAEQGNLYETYFKIIESMQDTNYEVFKTDNDQYSIEVYFINKKYPGVLTRFIIDNNGSFRRSIVGLKIGQYATETNKILEIAQEMENDVEQFLTSYEGLTQKQANITESVLFDDENSIEKIYENGYFELTGDGINQYNQYMGIENIVKNVQNDKQRFGYWNDNLHKIKDTRIERDAIKETTQSYQRKRK